MNTTIKLNQKFEIHDFFGDRYSAEILRKEIINIIEKGNAVTIDFEGVKGIGHSFADELFGLLVIHFGLNTIKEKLILTNGNSHIKTLTNLVVSDRVKKYGKHARASKKNI